jgi:ankyrin repeat protein
MACEQVPKLTYGNDVRGFLTPMASKAYSIQELQEGDPNELLLNFADRDENISSLKELIKNKNPDINYVRADGWTALLLSVANGEEKNAEYLLQKAADPNISTKHGATPLHFASQYGKLSLCKLLLDYHADINKCDIDGTTPLMKAARFGHNAIVKLLIQTGADTQLIDNKQKNALTYATEGKYGEICKQLRKK